MTQQAWQIHYSGSDTVGSALERLERASKQLEQALTEQADTLQATQADLRDVGWELEAVREIAEEARDAVAEA